MVRDDDEHADRPPDQPGWLDGLRALGGSGRRLWHAHVALLRAELGLARSAASWLFVALLVTVVSGVGFCLCLLALVAVALASWWGSWPWALAVLAALQLALLAAAVVAVRRLLRCLTLPHSRRRFVSLLAQRAPGEEAGAEGADAAEARTP